MTLKKSFNIFELIWSLIFPSGSLNSGQLTFVALLLLRCLTLFVATLGGAQQRHDYPRLRVYAHSGDQHFGTALHHLGAREQHRPRHTLLYLVRLASHARLVQLQVIGLDDQAVRRHQVTIEDLAHVSDKDLLHGQLLDAAVADRGHLLVGVDARLQAPVLNWRVVKHSRIWRKQCDTVKQKKYNLD